MNPQNLKYIRFGLLGLYLILLFFFINALTGIGKNTDNDDVEEILFFAIACFVVIVVRGVYFRYLSKHGMVESNPAYLMLRAIGLFVFVAFIFLCISFLSN